MPNSWYHTRLPKGVRDGQELDVAGPDSPRAASAGRETERSVVVGPDIPALPGDRGSAPGLRRFRVVFVGSGHSGWCPIAALRACSSAYFPPAAIQAAFCAP